MKAMKKKTMKAMKRVCHNPNGRPTKPLCECGSVSRITLTAKAKFGWRVRFKIGRVCKYGPVRRFKAQAVRDLAVMRTAASHSAMGQIVCRLKAANDNNRATNSKFLKQRTRELHLKDAPNVLERLLRTNRRKKLLLRARRIQKRQKQKAHPSPSHNRVVSTFRKTKASRATSRKPKAVQATSRKTKAVQPTAAALRAESKKVKSEMKAPKKVAVRTKIEANDEREATFISPIKQDRLGCTASPSTEEKTVKGETKAKPSQWSNKGSWAIAWGNSTGGVLYFKRVPGEGALKSSVGQDSMTVDADKAGPVRYTAHDVGVKMSAATDVELLEERHVPLPPGTYTIEEKGQEAADVHIVSLRVPFRSRFRRHQKSSLT